MFTFRFTEKIRIAFHKKVSHFVSQKRIPFRFAEELLHGPFSPSPSEMAVPGSPVHLRSLDRRSPWGLVHLTRSLSAREGERSEVRDIGNVIDGCCFRKLDREILCDDIFYVSRIS